MKTRNTSRVREPRFRRPGLLLALLSLGCASPGGSAGSAGDAPLLTASFDSVATSETTGFEVGTHGPQAHLRAAGLRAVPHPDGRMVVHPSDAPDPVLALELSAWGRGEELIPVEAAHVEPLPCPSSGPCGEPLTLSRGPVLEWWTATDNALQQGFELAAPPEQASGPLVLEVRVHSGEVVAAHHLRGRDGRTWSVGGLAAWDAEGVELGISIEARDDVLRLVVDDSAARYPISIDPIYQTGAWTIPVGDYQGLGKDMSLVGDVNGDGYDDAVIAASEAGGGLGWVGVYFGEAAPTYLADEPSQVLPVESPADAVGASVDGAGDINGDGYDDIVVGGPDTDSSTGAVWVYYGSATGVGMTTYTRLDGASAGDAFGTAVAGAGDVDADGYDDLFVGAPDASSDKGYLFLGSASGLETVATTTIASTSANFGSVAAGVGDVDGDGYDDVLIGAEGSSYVDGEAYVAYGSATGLLGSFLSTLSESWISQPEYYGSQVDGAGDLDGDGYDDVIVLSGTTSSSSGQSEYAFVYYGSSTGIMSSGGVDLTLSSSTWTTILDARVGGGGDINGDGYDDVVVSGLHSSSTYSAMLHYGGVSGVSSTADATLSGTELRLGGGLATGGDLDGDGYDDLLLAAPYEDHNGEVYLHVGTSTGLSSRLDTRVSPLGESTYLRVFEAGDLNGDGYADIAVSDYSFDYYTGIVHVYYGSESGPSSVVGTTLEPPTSSNYCGMSAAASDIDGDGVDDLLMGCRYTSSTPIAGYVYLGSSSGVSTTAFDSYGPTSGASSLGSLVGAVGDHDGDGYEGVVFSDTFGTLTFLDGSASGFDLTSAASLTVATGDLYSKIAAGDVNGDGYPDLVYNTGSWYAGLAVHHGSASGLASSASSTVSGTSTVNASDFDVCDVDGDGYDDIVVGDSRANLSQGEVRVYAGSSRGVSSSASSISGPSTGTYWAVGVTCAGDVDDDGYEDVAVINYSDDVVSLLPGSASGLVATTVSDVTFDSSAGFADDVVGGGDYDGDGYDDIWVLGADALFGFPGYSDPDDDGDGSPASEDCDDTDASAYPGATETCDSVDNDCDGDIDEDAPTWYADVDEDGYGDENDAVDSCTQPSGYVVDNTDCDDTEVTTYPGAAEACDGVDNDCSGVADDGLSVAYYVDSDGDGYGTGAATTSCTALAGYATLSGDCDDADSTANPGATEVCDGVDNDCNGTVDDGLLSDYYLDSDGDGYGAGTAVSTCSPASGYVTVSGDCDDADLLVYPGAAEVCNDTDDDCDGVSDDGLTEYAWYVDDDGDGFGDASQVVWDCSRPDGTVADGTDCDDSDSAVTDGLTWYADTDNDGFGNPLDTVWECAPPHGYIADNTDCDDTEASVQPGAPELAGDGIDQDCDGREDCYVDADDDGYAVDYVAVVESLDVDCLDRGEAAYGDPTDDCDDTDPDVHPGAMERAGDAVDQDCDGDELCFVDADDDGVRADSSSTVVSLDVDCGGAGEATEDAPLGDCNDYDASVLPGATEGVGDGVDQDCDGRELCYVDADDDGHRPDSEASVDSDDTDCDDAGEAVASDPDGDCDDTSADVHPGAEDVLDDGVDQDCDGADATASDTGVDGPATDDAATDVDKGGCSAAPSSATGGLALLLGIVAAGRRRRAGRDLSGHID